MSQDETVARILDHAAAIVRGVKGIVDELERWGEQPKYGIVQLGKDLRMTTATSPIDIPADDCPAIVDWYDRLGTLLPHSKTDTTWTAEDDNGVISMAVKVDANLDSDSDDETATVVFLTGEGLFKVVATTPSGNGIIRAESEMYHIQPGAPAVGQITLKPA